jgi:hypothetical protein
MAGKAALILHSLKILPPTQQFRVLLVASVFEALFASFTAD